MNRGVLITGGSRGIGAAMVRLFSAAGYRTAFIYNRSDDHAVALKEECGAFPIKADVSSEESVRRAFDCAHETIGDIDVLINNAGISTYGLFTDISLDEWNRMLDTNLGGTFLCCRAVLPEMIHRKSGKIINISSIWGITGASCEVHYSTSKAAIIGLTKALAKEVGPSGICVNCIAPGVIDTDMNRVLDKSALDALCDETPLGRLGTPDEVAKCALFLAGDGGDFITGQVISPNGGFLI